MKRILLVLVVVVALALPTVSVMAAPDALNPASLTWSVQYMIDQSQTVLGNSQATAPRDNRGLAISPDGRYLYAGYNNGYEIRKIDLTVADYTDATVARTTTSRGKAITVDDQGRVYAADGATVKILDANLSAVQYTIGMTKCEGVAVTRESGDLVLYASNRGTPNTLVRWLLTENAGAITNAVKAGLDGDGEITIAGASDMRGVAVDSAGRIWIADPSATYDPGKVFRVNSDGTGLVSNTAVSNPYAIAFSDGQALVTGGNSRVVSALDTESLAVVNTFVPPWTTLELEDYGMLSGIVVVPNGFYVTNEGGDTANEKSTYGRIDASSGTIDGKFYTDTMADDDDPILFAQTPTPHLSASATDGLICTGETTDVVINLADVANLYGYQFEVSYDATKASATGAFINTFFDVNGDGYAAWNATCAAGVCKFAKTDPAAPAVNGSGDLAKITLTGVAPGAFDMTISNNVLSDIDGTRLYHDLGAPLPITVCGYATVSGKVTLQGRPGNNVNTGTVVLTEQATASFGPHTQTATFSATDGAYTISNVPYLPTGSSYKIEAKHGLYLDNMQVFTLTGNVTKSTRLWGGDANNSGGIDISDLSCIGAAFGTGGTCAGTGSSDINADGVTNIQDLSIAGGNAYKTSPQAW